MRRVIVVGGEIKEIRIEEESEENANAEREKASER